MIVADEAAERAVLAAVLVRPACWPDVAAVLEPEAFGFERHRLLAVAIWACRRRGDEADLLTVGRELDTAASPASSRSILAQLADEVAPPNPVRHARRIRDLGAARRMLELLGDVAERSQRDALEDPIAWLDDVARRVAVAADVRRESALRHVSTYAEQHVTALVARASGVERGVSTGLDGLDRLTGGLHPSDYVVLAARPSCGKSALALQLATQAASDGAAVALFSVEMKAVPLLDRMVAERGNVSLQRIREGRLTEDEMRGVIGAHDAMRRTTLFMTDVRGWRVNEIVAQVRAWRREHAKDGRKAVVIVDYLQLVRASQRHGTREQEVAEVSWAFSTMAGEESVALMVLAQLTREAGKRPAEQLPQLEDLRESGAIEQDADGVWFVHRFDRIDPTIEEGAGAVVVAKQRQGPCGQVPVWFDGKHQRFTMRDRAWRRTGGSEDHEHQAAGRSAAGHEASRRFRGCGARGGQPDP